MFFSSPTRIPIADLKDQAKGTYLSGGSKSGKSPPMAGSGENRRLKRLLMIVSSSFRFLYSTVASVATLLLYSLVVFVF